MKPSTMTKTKPAGGCAVPLALALAACSSKVPPTRYYQLAPPPGPAPAGSVASVFGASARGDRPVLALETLAAEDAYQDERIVYRTSPYRLDYYQYHRWSAAPGVLIAGYLEQALQRSGRFRAVVRELDDGVPVVLGGRVIAIEEVDESATRWLGRLAVELTLKDARTGEVLWSEELSETEPLPAQTPEGLAQALSAAMGRIAARAIPEIAAHARRAAIPATARRRAG